MAYTTINKPSDYFNTKLYSGTGSNQAITGVGFQPDWVWLKRRDQTSWHYLFDAVRGANKTLYSNITSAETTDSNNLQSFDSDGFTVGTQGDINESGGSYVGWNWLGANGTASNTDGSITSTVSANTTSGFSIVSYTGTGSNATVGHGLGVAPSMIIEKGRSVTDDWLVYHKSLGATYGLALNNTTAAAASTGYWNDTAPTSSLFTIGNNGKVNTNGGTHVAYCFAEKTGYSKFGTYTGNGDSDGTFVYTGFKPAFVMVKVTNTTNSWDMYDSARNPFNDVDLRMYADLNNADNSDPSIDFVSNGFKLRDTLGANNGSGNSYIYMAFASEPLVGDNPATAR